LPGSSSITAVIPLHNQAALLARLLASLRNQTLRPTEIIVVDNASTDGAAEVADQHGCRVLRLESNTGFAHAVNTGWRASKTEWVAILNSDIELDAHWLQRLAAAAHETSFATGTIVQAANPQAIDGTYDLLSRAGCAWRAGFGQPVSSVAPAPFPIAIAPATACLFRRDVLDQLGGFDETYDSYLEDVDLGLRCIQAGVAGVFVPDAVATHQGSATLGRWNPRVVRLISRNQLRLVARHYDRELFLSCLWHIFTGQLLWGLVALRHGAGLAWLRGKLDALGEFHLSGEPGAALRRFLDASESEIRERATDSYWRWYARLTAAH
jgi:GT2 family glycosyltransferase